MSAPSSSAGAGPVDDGLAALLEGSRELLVVLGSGCTVRWLSPAAERWLGPGVLGRPLTDLVHRTDVSAVGLALTALTERAVPSGRSANLTCRLRRADGGHRAMELSITDRRDHPRIAGIVCVAREAVEDTEAAARLIHQASHDTLTALPNRSLLLDRLSPTGVHGGDRPCALLYLDLDGFKAVNDSFGHSAGDRVLVTMADRLRRSVRPGDTVARLHGDEFVVVAAGVADRDVAVDIAERIVGSIRRPVVLNGRLVTVSASVGIALGPGSRAVALIEEADLAMFSAKEAGRNRCAVWSAGMRSVDENRRAAEQLLRDALDHDGGLTPLYRPIVHVASGHLAGVEAVLRVRRPDGTLVSPTGFMELAEGTGLAVAVGSGLLDLACRQQARWQRQLGAAAPALLSVPTSRRQLCDRRAATRVATTLDRHGIDPSTVCLGLPEDCLADADSDVARTLEIIKSRGVRLAIDGFGRGRSSLAYLHRFGVDVLRIDRSLLAGVGRGDGEHGDSGTEVVRAVVGLGRALGMTTVATGVDTEAQARVVAELGCPLAEGAHFDRPTLPAGPPVQTR